MLKQTFVKTHYLYTPLFCEENIWQLLNSLSEQGLVTEKMWVLMLTNPERKVPLFNQQAAQNNQAVIWDYHVVLLTEINHQHQIFDFDSRLAFNTPLRDYVHNTLIEPSELPEDFRPYIRKIPARSYLDKFHSDRSHMVNQIDSSEFPPWPLININQQQPVKLADYLDLTQSLDDGSEILKPVSLAELIHSLQSR